MQVLKPIFYIQSESKGKFVKIRKQEIIYVESALNYLQIHLAQKSFLTYLTIPEMAAVLPDGDFMQVNKSYIINLDEVSSIQANFISMSNDKKIALGAHYRKGFFEVLNPLLLKSKRQFIAK